MTTTVLRHSASTESFGAGLARAFGGVKYVVDRARSRRVLAGLDARMLADIGVTRDQAMAESNKAFWQA
jgi:uncharacterized protein YjiS (DUF1127 family)